MPSVITSSVEFNQRANLPPRPCRTCHESTGRLKRGRCDACYAYSYKYGHERPPHLWRRDFTGRRAEH